MYVHMFDCTQLAELLVSTAKKEGVSCHMDFAIKVSMVVRHIYSVTVIHISEHYFPHVTYVVINTYIHAYIPMLTHTTKHTLYPLPPYMKFVLYLRF